MDSLKPLKLFEKHSRTSVLNLLLATFAYTWCIIALNNVCGILILTATLFLILTLCLAEGKGYFRRAILDTKFYIIVLLAMYLFVRNSLAYDVKSGLVASFKEISYYIAPTLFYYVKEKYSPTSKKNIIDTICTIWVLIAFVQLFLYLTSDFDYAREAISVRKDLFSIANHTYDFCYSACFIGIACFEKILDKHVRYKIVFLFVVATFVVIFTKSTIAILAYAASIVVCFISKKVCKNNIRVATKGSKRSISKTGIAILIVTIFGIRFRTQIGYLFKDISNIFSGTLRVKLIDVATFFISGTESNSMSVRRELYSLSLENALKHPVLGNMNAYARGDDVIGMHSEIFDTLSLYGFIFTMIQYGWIFYILMKNKSLRKNYTNSVIIFFVLINLLNPFNYYTGYFALLFLTPALLDNWEDPYTDFCGDIK